MRDDVTAPPCWARYEAIVDETFMPPPQDFMFPNGIRDASLRHDALASRKYVKPFKWFKFNRARKATAK